MVATGRENHGKDKPSRAHPQRIGEARIDSGLEIRTTPSLSGRGRSFFLTSLFIELIDLVHGSRQGNESKLINNG
jgi:hypothetical protein